MEAEHLPTGSNLANKFPQARRWLFLIVAALLILIAPDPLQTLAPVNRHFRLFARSFQYSPAILHVNPGDTVTIDLISTDVVHGLSLDGYDVDLTADPGQTASVTFVADKKGSYRFRCSVACGNLHPFMMGKLIVGRNALFWRVIALSFLSILAGIWSVQR